MEANAGFGSSQLFLTDSRLVVAVLNHLRYRALNRAFGVSRDQANLLTVALLLGAADGAYVAARRISVMRPRVSGTDAAVGAFALREAALGVAGPSARDVPRFGTLVAFAMLGGLAAPSLRRTAQRMRAAEGRVRRERIRRYVAARDRERANSAQSGLYCVSPRSGTTDELGARPWAALLLFAPSDAGLRPVLVGGDGVR